MPWLARQLSPPVTWIDSVVVARRYVALASFCFVTRFSLCFAPMSEGILRGRVSRRRTPPAG
jgi:hypothetical protein